MDISYIECMRPTIKCRACKSTKLEVLIELGEQYLTGVFPKTSDEAISKGPLTLVRCSGEGSCGLVQLKHSYDLSEMYGDNYGYRSGLNASMVRHLQGKVKRILSLKELSDDDLVIDIGSNDGTTLSSYPSSMRMLVGVDPTAPKFIHHYPKHIKVVPDFFTRGALKNHLGLSNISAKVITSFSMFYDLEDPVAFATEVCNCLSDDGIWVFEQSYLPSMLQTNSYDTICHEHIEFYGLHQIKWIANQSGLKIVDVEFNEVNGGSFSVTAAKSSSPIKPNGEYINSILQNEIQLGINTNTPYEIFRSSIDKSRVELLDFLMKAKSQGKRVVGLGASTKGNVLLQYCGIDPSMLSVIGDVNPDKFGCYTPGTNIPIEDEEIVLNSSPDYLLVLPWHFREFFLNNNKFKGMDLVFPLPHLEIVRVQ